MFGDWWGPETPGRAGSGVVGCVSLSLSVSGDSGGARCWLAGATGESQPGQCQSVLTETSEPADSVTLTLRHNTNSPDLLISAELTDWLTQTGCCLKYFQSGREWQGEWEIILSTGRSDGGELGDCQDLHNIWEFLRFQFAILHDIELGGTQDELITSNYQLCCSHFYLLSFSASITAEL